MPTILTTCRVPWTISPTTSGVTLIHSESDVEPECTVVLGGGRLVDADGYDSRRIEIKFLECYYARVGHHRDTETVEAIGYEIADSYSGDMNNYIDWLNKIWSETGNCPDSGFYFAQQSDWLSSLPSYFQQNFRHYVIDGRDGYVELVAKEYTRREWIWSDGHREESQLKGPVVGSGNGVE